MFGRKRSRPQPYATYLLPSFPGFSWNRKSSITETATTTKVQESQAHQVTPVVDSDLPLHRYSVASTTSTASSSSSSSTATVTSTATAPSLSTSLSTSPCSLLSTTPHSISSMTLPVPFPAFGNNDDHEPVAPVYLTSLTAEPKVVDGASPKDSQDTKEAPTFKLGPQVGPSVSPRVPYPGRQPPFRHLQRVLPTTLRCRRCSADLAFASQIVSKGFTGRHGRAYLVSAPASHADHLFAPEVKPMQDDDDTVLWDNEEEGAIWEDSGVSEMAEEERGADDDTASDVSLARGLVRVGGIQDLPNIRIGRAEYRRLVTGAHVVADISCAVCCSKVGWKYIDASDPAQRYKVGKFILELAMLSTFHSWEEVDDDEGDMEGLANNVGTVCTLNAQYRKGRLQAEGELYDSDDDEDCDPNRIEFDSEDEDECEEIFNGTWDAAVVARRRAMKRADELRRSFMAS